MLRISIDESESEVAILRVEGEIAGAWISELSKTCERMLSVDRKVVLDLADVSFIDRPGLTLLASFARREVVLLRCSPFQEAQLKQATTPPHDVVH